MASRVQGISRQVSLSPAACAKNAHVDFPMWRFQITSLGAQRQCCGPKKILSVVFDVVKNLGHEEFG